MKQLAISEKFQDMWQYSVRNEGNLNISDINYCITTHEEVVKSRKFNFEGCRIPVNTRMNIDFIRSWLQDYEDTCLCDFLNLDSLLVLQM